MNRNMIVLNVILGVLVCALGWTLRLRWLDSQEQDRELLARRGQAPVVIAPPPLQATKNVTPAQYFEVADRTLFSKDRNPTVIVDPPKPPPPPPPPPPMPELPFFHGEMAIGEPVILLSTAKIPQRSYHAGDSVGDFKVLRFDRDKVTFDWNGKPVERNVSELRPKENTQTAQQVPSGAPSGVGNAVANGAAVAPADPPSAFRPYKPGSGGGGTSTVTVLGGKAGDSSNTGGNSSSDSGIDNMLGPELSPTERACVDGDNSPSGMSHSGYRKVSMITLLGPICHWEKQQ